MGVAAVASPGPTARSLARAADGARLAPGGVKAVYLSYYGVAEATIRGRVLDLLDRTELNAVVIDVKGDRGFIPYATSVELAGRAGARGPVRWGDFDATLERLKAGGVSHPYEVVAETVRRLQVRSRHTRVVVRPWIQDFRDYAFDRRPFGLVEVREQIRAAEETGAS